MKWSQVPWTTVVTGIVALYGAALSTFNAALQLKKDRPRLNVKLSTAILGMADGTAPLALIVEVQNTGFRGVEIRSIQFPLSNKQKLVFLHLDTDSPLPHQLEPGRRLTAWVLASAVAHGLLKRGFSDSLNIKAECRDGTDNRYQSKPLQIDANSLLSLDSAC